MKNKTIPFVSRHQMKKIDQIAIEEYHISLIQMMENAGRNMADLARKMLSGELFGKSVAIFCGKGNNGGGGLAAARHLINWGAQVQIILSAKPNEFTHIPKLQLSILEKMNADIGPLTAFITPNLMIDALIGYGIQGNPKGNTAVFIEVINESDAPVLSLDIPSGMDPDSGLPHIPCVQATATLTLALPKTGFIHDASWKYIGDLFLADIGIPPILLQDLGISADLLNNFQYETVMSIRLERKSFVRNPEGDY